MAHFRTVETVVRSDLGPWSAQWDALVGAMLLPTPFLRSWWLAHTAEGEPQFVLLVDGERLLGGAAFQVTRRYGCEWVQLLGDGPLEPDHLDLVAAPADRRAVVDAVRHWLGRDGSRVVDVAGVAPDAAILDALPGRGRTTPLSVAPYAALPAGIDEYLAGRQGTLRSTISRTRKRLQKLGVECRVAPADAVDASLAALEQLHDERWGDESGFAHAWRRFAAAARDGAAAGDVRFVELVDADGNVIAIEVELCVADRMCFYQAGRLTDHEWRGSGSWLKAEAIELAISEGATEYDLLRGDEPYKAQWSTATRSLVRHRAGVGPRGLAVVAAAEANAELQRRRAAWLEARAERGPVEKAPAPPGT